MTLVALRRMVAIILPLPLLVRSALFAGLVGVLFFLASYGSLHRGGQERIAEAYAQGALTGEMRGNDVIGLHQFNDCLILGLALAQTRSDAELTVSPVKPFGISELPCVDLKNSVQGNELFYHNYLHGHTVLVRYLLPHMGVQTIRELLKATMTLVLLFGVALCLLRIGERRAVGEQLVFLVAFLGFSRFFSLELFSQSLSHGPSDLVLLGFVALLAVKSGTLSEARWTTLACLFGALTMIFEFMTGGLPIGAAAVIGLGWFALRPESRSVAAVLRGLVAFLTGAATLMLIKLTSVAIVFGADAVRTIFETGAIRVNGDLPSQFAHFVAWRELAKFTWILAPGLPALAPGMLVVSVLLGARAVTLGRDPVTLLLLLSCLPIVAWFLLFQQHTAIHAWFMVRILVWPIIAGFSAFAWASCATRATVEDAKSMVADADGALARPA